MSQQTADHYEVLGVEVTASTEEIKKAYRQKARELHPDHNPDPAAEEEFKRVTHAHDVLSNPVKKAEYDLMNGYSSSHSSVHQARNYSYNSYAGYAGSYSYPYVHVPEPEQFVYCDVMVCVTYYPFGHYATDLVADLTIQLDDIAKLTDLPNPTHTVRKVWQVHIMQGDEEVHVAWVDDSIQKLREATHQFVQQRGLYERVTCAKLKLDSMTCNELPTEEARRLYDTAALRVTQLTYPHDYVHVSYDSALAAVRALEKEIERLELTDPTDLLVDGLMNGSLYPEIAEHNREVLRQIEIFTIRSGGIWETEMNEADLRAFYRKGLNGATTLRDVWLIDIKLDLNHYIVEDESLAPERLILNTRKGEKAYGVHYFYSDVKGVRTPSGAIKVPLSVFKQFASDSGKKSTFPDLGHGIKLWVIVKIAGGKYVSGWADDTKLFRNIGDERRATTTPSYPKEWTDR